MAKLRQRMSCRRGSSRGQMGRQGSSSTTYSSNFCSDFRMDQYPATRSGRGRGRGMHNLAASSFNSATNSARLQFPCTHGNFSFMAIVTIELSEINAGQEAASLGVTKEMQEEDRFGTIQMKYEQSKASGSGKGMASQIMNDQAGPSVPIGGGSTSKEGHPSEDDDDYKYGCRIIEEQPSTSHDV